MACRPEPLGASRTSRLRTTRTRSPSRGLHPDRWSRPAPRSPGSPRPGAGRELRRWRRDRGPGRGSRPPGHRPALERPRDHNPLLVPTRKAHRGASGPAAVIWYSEITAARVRLHSRPSQPESMAPAGVPVPAKHEVLRQGHLRNQAFGGAVLRHESHRPLNRCRRPVERQPASAGAPGLRSRRFRPALRHGSRRNRSEPARAVSPERCWFPARTAAPGVRLSDHGEGQARLGLLLHQTVKGDLAGSEHGDPIGDGEHLGELMGDQRHRPTPAREGATRASSSSSHPAPGPHWARRAEGSPPRRRAPWRIRVVWRNAPGGRRPWNPARDLRGVRFPSRTSTRRRPIASSRFSRTVRESMLVKC